jgi:hypothetical protein
MKNDTFKLVSESFLLTADEALAQMADIAQKQAVDFADILGARLVAHCDGSKPLQPIAYRVITARYNAAHIVAMQAIADFAAITGPQS